jgi:AraC family transcriptional regulator
MAPGYCTGLRGFLHKTAAPVCRVEGGALLGPKTTMPWQSEVPFLDPRTGRPIQALAQARTLATSAGLGWNGLHAEAGINGPWRADDLAVGAHYLALNTDAKPLHFFALRDGRREQVTLEPGAVWFCPAGESFSHDVPMSCSYALVTLEPEKLARLAQADGVALRRAYGVKLGQFEHLMRALVEEARTRGPGGVGFADAVAAALAAKLVETFGTAKQAAELHHGGLPPARLRRVRALVEEAVRAGEGGAALEVDVLAREAGLSPAHFARAFKAATGETPHAYVLGLKLEKAREAIAGGAARASTIAEVAVTCGFFDQAHLTRHFRRKFGVTPGCFAREAAARCG